MGIRKRKTFEKPEVAKVKKESKIKMDRETGNTMAGRDRPTTTVRAPPGGPSSDIFHQGDAAQTVQKKMPTDNKPTQAKLDHQQARNNAAKSSGEQAAANKARNNQSQISF